MPSVSDADFKCDFIPVIDAMTGETMAYYCRPSGPGADGAALSDEAFLASGSKEDQSLDAAPAITNMRLTLDAAFQKARELAGGGAGLIAPINGQGLANETMANIFTSVCQENGKDAVGDIVFEVTNASDQATMDFLDELAVVMFPFCKAYTARVPLDVPDVKVYCTCNYAGVAIDLENKPWTGEEVGDRLAALVQMAEGANLKAHVHGIGTEEVLSIAQAAGAHLIDGDAVSAG